LKINHKNNQLPGTADTEWLLCSKRKRRFKWRVSPKRMLLVSRTCDFGHIDRWQKLFWWLQIGNRAGYHRRRGV